MTTTDAERAAEVAREVEAGRADKMTKFLFGLLPKSAHGKIPDILREFETQLAENGNEYFEVGQCVEVDPLARRAVADTVQAYGLELGLDVAGLAVSISTPYRFVA